MASKFKKVIKLVSLFSYVLVITSCASVGITTIKKHPPRGENCSIDIYTDKKEIKVPYEVISLIDSHTGSTLVHVRTASQAIENAKPAACEAGANAMLIESTDTEGVTYGRWGQGKAIIKALRYKKTENVKKYLKGQGITLPNF